MVTTVAINGPWRRPDQLNNPSDKTELLIRTRAVVDMAQAFASDLAQTRFIDTARVLPQFSKEELEAAADAGLGTSGIFAFAEPRDLALYESYIPAPLQMPSEPQISLIFVDYHAANPLMSYQEGWIMLKARRPDNGQDVWQVISQPVSDFFFGYAGVALGSPKYVADRLTIESTHAEAIYEGKLRFALTLEPSALPTSQGFPEISDFGMDSFVLFLPTKNGRCPINYVRKGVEMHVVERTTGMVKVDLRPQDQWSGLIDTQIKVPGVYQRYLLHRGQLVWEKVSPRS